MLAVEECRAKTPSITKILDTYLALAPTSGLM